MGDFILTIIGGLIVYSLTTLSVIRKSEAIIKNQEANSEKLTNNAEEIVKLVDLVEYLSEHNDHNRTMINEMLTTMKHFNDNSKALCEIINRREDLNKN